MRPRLYLYTLQPERLLRFFGLAAGNSTGWRSGRAMSELEALSSLVGDIYDASLDPSLWPKALRKLCAFVPGHHANIFIQDSTRQSVNLTFSWGDDPYWQKLYLEKYARMNPLFPALMFWEVGKVFATFDVVPAAQLYRTQFYREWLEPQGYTEAAAAILEKSRTSLALVAVPRAKNQGPVDKASRKRLQLLVPHIRRAVLIGKAIDLQKTTVAALTDALDAVSAAVFLVDAGGHVVHCNASGTALLAESGMLHSANGSLRARQPAIDKALREILSLAASGDDVAIGSMGIALPLEAKDGERYVAHVLPLSCGARGKAKKNHTAALAIFVHKTALQKPTLVEALAEQYRLTPTELRVLFAIVEIGGVPEIAPVLGIGEGTIKTHLKHIYAKTGASRHVDLAKLVAEFANPLG